MKKKIVLVTFIFIFLSCNQKENIYKNELIGKWEGKTDWADLILTITKDTFSYDEKISNTKFNCHYIIKSDTIFLELKDSIEKHSILIIDKNILKLNTLTNEYKDVPLLDGLDFKRIID